MVQIKLGEFYETYPMPGCPVILKTFYIPKEHVVDTPTMVIPDVGRIYSTNLYMVDDFEFVEYDELLKIKGKEFKGTEREKRLVIVEAWEDVGDDGHINYKLCGYVLAIDNDYTCQNPLQWLRRM